MVGRVVLVTAVAALLALPARAAAADRCHLPRGAHVLAHSRIATVYRVDTPTDRVNTNLKYLACLHSTGRRVVLDDRANKGGATGGDDAIARVFTFSGWLVAFVLEVRDHYNGSGGFIVVVDLRRGAMRYSVSAGSQLGGPYQYFSTLSLALAPTGMTAWVVRRMGVPEVGAAGADGAGPVPLDRGIGIDPGSLRLLGGTVSWTKDGVPQYATPFP
jgi:hypothetical protein